LVTAQVFAPEVAAQSNTKPSAGAYLAARQAAFGNDFSQAARYHTQALLTDPANPQLLEGGMAAYLALGNIDAAGPIADAMIGFEINSQIAHLVRNVRVAQKEDWRAIFQALEAGHEIGPLIDGLSQAWAHMGQGEVRKAMERFDAVIAAPETQAYGLLHKALALAMVGDFEAAAEILSPTATPQVRHSRRSAIAMAQMLSQLERNTEAVALLDGVFGGQLDASLESMRAALIAGETLTYTSVPSPKDGFAEIYFNVASALRDEAPNSYVLLYLRAALALRPSDTEMLLVTADLLDDMEQYALAQTIYAQVAIDDPSYIDAELGRADALIQLDNFDAAVEALQTLARTYPERAQIHATLGDTWRRKGDMQAANDAYSDALARYPEDSPALWFVYYTRAITFHQLDQWAEAEADFRKSLTYRPDQAQVLNYLGYSLVERNEKLDEALDMIERAVAAQPDNGAIVDSLAWVYFRLGRYADAVTPMERAATLEPVDPIVLDHLGDVYWAVGRKLEAAFQWQRALSFDPEEEEADRIRRKLEVGLDAVLVTEGQDPIHIAQDAN
jgi:tetratricopeptide (TPR) repeat protein